MASTDTFFRCGWSFAEEERNPGIGVPATEDIERLPLVSELLLNFRQLGGAPGWPLLAPALETRRLHASPVASGECAFRCTTSSEVRLPALERHSDDPDGRGGSSSPVRLGILCSLCGGPLG